MKLQKSFDFAPAKTHPNYWQHSKLWPILIFWETVTFGFALDLIIVGQIIQYQITSKAKNWTAKCRKIILVLSNIPGWHFATFFVESLAICKGMSQRVGGKWRKQKAEFRADRQTHKMATGTLCAAVCSTHQLHGKNWCIWFASQPQDRPCLNIMAPAPVPLYMNLGHWFPRTLVP